MTSPKRQVGGALQPDDPTYVKRKADEELFDAISAGKFSYVLTSRQMGKSSLVARLKKQLQNDGWLVSVVDLSLIGSTASVTEEQWYYGAAYRIAQDLNIVESFKSWWAAHTELTRAQTFSDFIRELVLGGHAENIALFFDEIDSTLPLDFTDDFFAAVRAIFNARAMDDQFSRISITLLGVATPDQLISDKRRTPFNIGSKIDLTDFTLQQVIKGPAKDLSRRQAELVFEWTSGHPYLTQRLLNELENEESRDSLHNVVDSIFLNPTHGNEDSNLTLTAARLASADDNRSAHQREVLRVYKQLLKGKKIEEEPQSPVHNELKLSGIARVDEQGHLTIRNRIYREVFNKTWISSVTAGDKQLRQVRYQAIAATAVLALITFSSWYLRFYPQQLIKEINLVTEDKVAAESIAENLRRVPWRNDDASRSLADFWERKALAAEHTDAGKIHLLKAYGLEKTAYRKAKLANRLNGSVKGAERLVTTLRHVDEVRSVAFSADGQLVLTGSSDNTARVWDARSGQPVTEPLRHNGTVWSVTFSTDGQYVLTGSSDNTARVWDARSGQPVTEPLRHDGLVGSVAFSADGQYVLTGSRDNTARVWDARSGQPVTTLLHEDWVRSVAFSADGKHVLTGSDDNTARIWDARSGQSVNEPLRHDGTVWSVAFSPVGQHVLTGSDDNTARIWDARSGQPVNEPLRHDGAVWSVAFSTDGQHVLTGSEDNTARLWDVSTGQPVTEPLRHDDAVWSVAFSTDGQHVLTSSMDNTTRVWDARSGQPAREPLRNDDFMTSVAFSADGQYVLTGSDNNTARVWDVRSGQPVKEPLNHVGFVISVAFSADGQYMLTGGFDGTARVWDARSGQPVSEPLRHDGTVWSVAFSPDGLHVLTGSNDNTARVWDARSGQPIAEPLRHDGFVISVAFSADGRYVLTGSNDNTARIWDARSGQPITEPLGHVEMVRSVAFSADGRHVLTGSNDNTARVWDARSGQPVTEPLRHDGPLWSVAFSADGKNVLTGSVDGTARVWDVRSGQPVTEPLRHDGWVRAVAFSPDGQHVLTGSDDNTARIWDARSGQPVTEPLRHDGKVWSVAFSADGVHVLTASDSVVREWSVGTGKLLGEFNLGFGYQLVNANYLNDGRTIGVVTDWNMSTIESKSNEGTVLPENFSPNQLSQLSQPEIFGDHQISLFPLVDISELNIENVDTLVESLKTKFVLKEDEKGTLFYPYKVQEEPEDINEQRSGIR